MNTYQKPPSVIDLRDKGRIILAYGEATGHHHEVSASLDTGTIPEADFFEEPDGRRVLIALAPCWLRHPEHGAIALDPVRPQQLRQGDVLLTPIGAGAWAVTRQDEYIHGSRRSVMD